MTKNETLKGSNEIFEDIILDAKIEKINELELNPDGFF